MFKRIVLAIGLATLLAPACFAEVGLMSLDKLVDCAGVIVIGRVAKVITVGGAPSVENDSSRIAGVDVTRTLKGDQASTRLYYVASASRHEAVSDAKEGEAGIFFPAKAPADWSRVFYNGPGSAVDLSGVNEKVHRLIQDGPLFSLMNSVRGRGKIRVCLHKTLLRRSYEATNKIRSHKDARPAQPVSEYDDRPA